MNTTENNKLIAEFMGFSPVYFGKHLLFIKESKHFLDTELVYNSSWDWLMSVIDKIEGIQYSEDLFYDVVIGGFLECTIQDRNGNIIIEPITGNSKIEAVYTTIVKFINWYNETNK